MLLLLGECQCWLYRPVLAHLILKTWLEVVAMLHDTVSLLARDVRQQCATLVRAMASVGRWEQVVIQVVDQPLERKLYVGLEVSKGTR
jgi:hypothetical protein